MMLQKALKMDSADAYYDVLSDLKFMGNNVSMIELPYNSGNPNDGADIAHITAMDPSSWKNAAGVLTMVMQPLMDVSGSTPLPPPPPPPSSSVVGSYMHSFGHAYLHKPHKFPPSTGLPPALPPGITVHHSSAGPSIVHPPESSASSPNNKTSTATTSQQQSQTQGQGTGDHNELKIENDGLRLLLSPWQQMMYVPPQQALVIDRMHSGARRFVVLDFGSPILLTDMIIPACNDLVSLSIDIWLHREDTDG